MGVILSAFPLAAGSWGNDLADRHDGSGRIVPALEEPADDHHFFKHDYPRDRQPVMEDKWSHPFPIVQDTDDYEKDYVKDENSDGGRWKLDMEYNTLRSRLVAARAAKMQAAEAVNETGGRLRLEEGAKSRLQKALEAKNAALREAELALETAEAKYNAAKSVSSNAVDKQEKVVARESKKAAECRAELEKARAHLRDMQEQRVKAEDELRESIAEEEVAEARQLEKEQDEAALEEKAGRASAEYDKAHARYQKSAAEEEAAGRKLEAQEEELRRFRHPKSFGVPTCGPSFSLMALVLVTVHLAIVGF